LLLAFKFDSSSSLCPGGSQLSTFYLKMEDSHIYMNGNRINICELILKCLAKVYAYLERIEYITLIGSEH
jgi:hypothetical protein